MSPIRGYFSPRICEELTEEAFKRLDGARKTDAETGAMTLRAVYRNGPRSANVSRGSGMKSVTLDDGTTRLMQVDEQGKEKTPSKKDYEPSQARTLDLLLRLLGRLDHHLSNCESDLADGLRETPLHGLLLATRSVECMGCWAGAPTDLASVLCPAKSLMLFTRPVRSPKRR